jgi:hypothetical protein
MLTAAMWNDKHWYVVFIDFIKDVFPINMLMQFGAVPLNSDHPCNKVDTNILRAVKPTQFDTSHCFNTR